MSVLKRRRARLAMGVLLMSAAATAQPLTVVKRVAPEYPAIARQAGARGDVQMSVTVAPDGHVTEVKVLSGHPMLQKAAKEAVQQWVYAPRQEEATAVVALHFEGPPAGLAPQGGTIQQAVLINRTEPIYPDMAKRTGAVGRVVLQATIGKDGHVKAVRVISGHPMLQNAAMDAVMQWIYRPTLLNGQPVETETQITLNFMGSSTPIGLEPAELIERKEPVPEGELATIAGSVTFRAKVGQDGRLSEIRVADGTAELVAPALAAVKQWRYRPAKLNGEPVEAFTDITVQFKPTH